MNKNRLFFQKINWKRQLWGTPSGSQPAFAYQPALRSKQNMKKYVFCSFSHVFYWYQAWNHWKRFKMNKKVENGFKKVVPPAFGCTQHPKAGRHTPQFFNKLFIFCSHANSYLKASFSVNLCFIKLCSIRLFVLKIV